MTTVVNRRSEDGSGLAFIAYLTSRMSKMSSSLIIRRENENESALENENDLRYSCMVLT